MFEAKYQSLEQLSKAVGCTCSMNSGQNTAAMDLLKFSLTTQIVRSL